MKRFCAVAALLTAATTALHAASFTWTGSVSGDWFNPTNWNPQGVPGGADTAVISGGSPTLSTATNVGTVNLSGGTLSASGVLTVSNLFNWTAGAVNGELVVSTNATLNLNYPGNYLYMQDAAIVNNGTVAWNGGTLYCDSNTRLTNNGLWLAQSDDSIYNPYGGPGVFCNNGTLTKSPTTHATQFSGVSMLNFGTVNAESGLIYLNSGGYLDGSFNATNAANVLAGGTFTYGPAASFNGPGTNEMTGGSMELTNAPLANLVLAGGTITLGPAFENGSITNLSIAGATLDVTNSVTGYFDFSGNINGALTVAAGTNAFITNLSLSGALTVSSGATLNFVTSGTKSLQGATVVNNGTILWDGGTLVCNSGTVITNGGTWQAETDDYIYNYYGGNALFYNSGSFIKSPTTGTTTFAGVYLLDTGSIIAETGTISLTDGAYLDGLSISSNNAAIQLSGGTFNTGPDVAFSGSGNYFSGGTLTLTNVALTNLNLNGGTVDLSPTFDGGTITNLTLTGATLNGTNTVTGNLNFSGTVTGALTVAAGASCYITNLNFNGLLTIATNATLNFVTGGAKTFNNSTVVNNGTVAWDGGTLSCESGTVITNNGTWEAETDDYLYNPYGGTLPFYNYGLFVKSPTTGTTTVQSMAFNNYGTLAVETGTVQLNGGGLFYGNFQVSNGAELMVGGGGFLDGTFTGGSGGEIALDNGTFTYGPNLSFLTTPSQFTGGSILLTDTFLPNLALNGGTVTLSPTFQGGTITNLTLSGATLAGTNTLTGVMHWQGGTLTGAFTIASQGLLYLDGDSDVQQYAALTNSGHIIWNGAANWRVLDDTGTDGVINNLAGGTIDLACNQSLYPPNSSTTWFLNAGLLRKLESSGSSSISVTLTNTGQLEVLSGQLSISYGDFGGQIEVGNGDALYLTGGGVLEGAFTAGQNALVQIDGGAFTQTAALSLAGAGTYLMNSSATLTLLNSTIPNLQIQGGTVMMAPGFQGGSITNLTLNGVSVATSNFVTGTLTVNGTINAPVTVASNAVFTWNGTVNAPITALPGAILNWQGGSLNTTLLVPTNSVLNFPGPNQPTIANWLTNEGTINWTAGNIQIYCGYGLYNNPGATFNIQCDNTLNDWCGPEFINNAGVINKLVTLNAPGTGTTTIDVTLINSGTTAIQDGGISFNGYVTNTPAGLIDSYPGAGITLRSGAAIEGTYNAGAGAVVNFNNGPFTLDSPYYLTGPGTFELTGGTLTLTTNAIPALSLQGGTISTAPGFQGGSVTNLTLNGLNLGDSNYVTGSLTVYGSINAPVTVASNAVLTWNGNVNAPITALPGAILNCEGGNINNPLFIPTNAVLNFPGPNQTTIAAWLTNAGTINWTGANVQLYCGYGLYNNAGATFNIECDNSFYNWCGSEFISNAGSIYKMPTTGTSSIDVALYNAGLVDVESGGMLFNSFYSNSVSAVIECASNTAVTYRGGAAIEGAYSAPAGATMNFNGGTFNFVPPYALSGAGTYEFTGGTMTLLTNTIGNLAIEGGTILTGPAFQGGVITNLVLNGAALGTSNYVTGALTVLATVNAPVTVASNAVFTWNGTVNGQITALPGAILNCEGGSLNTPLLVPTNAVLNFPGPNQPTVANWLTNAGTINWTAANLQIYCGYGIYNSGQFNIQCDQTLYDWCGSEFVNNTGLLRKFGTSGETYFQVAMDNSGTLDAESGEIRFQAAFNQTGGSWTFGLDGLGNNGSFSFNSAPALPQTLNVGINNDYILGLSNSFTLANYPSAGGVIGQTNLPAEGSSWNLSVGSTALTLLLTNLNAPQNVTLTSPAAGQHFTIPVNIPITATASGSAAPISSIEFFQGTNLLGQASSSPYTYTWNNVQPGNYSLSALAIDTAGAMATSAPVSITVYYNHAQGTNYTWNGTVSSDWFTAANWTPSGVPGALDSAVLANNGTIALSQNVAIAGWTMNNGTLQGSGALTVTNAATVTGGNLVNQLNVATNAVLNVANSFYLGGVLVNNGTVTWNGGSIGGSASSTITNNGLWLAEASSSIGFNNGTAAFVNNGIFRATNESYTSINSLDFINNGLVDVGEGSFYFNSGGTLAGAYNADAGTALYFNGGTFNLGAQPVFTGAGAFYFNGGTLNIANNPAPALELTGGTVVLGPVFQNAGAITNLTLSGSILSGSNTVTGTFNWNSGGISGQLNVSPQGVLDIATGNSHSMNSSALVNAGLVTWSGGYITGDGNSLVTNNGTWLTESDYAFYFGNGNSTFVNNGLFEKTNTTGTTSFNGLIFVNNGTVDAASGSIYFQQGGVLAGTYDAGAGGSIYFNSGNFILGALPTLGGAGNIYFSGGNMVISNEVAPGLQLIGGTVVLGPNFEGGVITSFTNNGSTLSGSYTITGSVTWLAGGVSGSLTVATNALLDISGSRMDFNNSAFTNNGTVVWSSGGVHGGAATVINNGLWIASANNYIDNGDCCGSYWFTNNGTFRVLSSANFSGVSLANNGLIDVEDGTLYLYDGGALAGQINVGPFGSLQLSSGNFTVGAPPLMTGSGTSQFTGGTLTLLADAVPNLQLTGGTVALGSSFQNAGAITNLTLSGSTLAGSNTVTGTLTWTSGNLSSGILTIAPNGLLNITTGNTKYLPSEPLVNNGTVTWQGGSIQGNSAAFVTNAGLWQVQTDNSFQYGPCCGNPTFVNIGTFVKSSTFGSTTFNDAAFINLGTLDLESGSLNFAGSGTYAQAGATLVFGVTSPALTGQLNVPTPVSFDGTLSVHFLNGYAPQVGDQLQLINYPSESGSFAQLNFPALPGGESWDFEVAGSVSLTVVPSATAGTNTLQITGTVMSTGNQPIAGVTVYAALNGSNLVQNGSFEMPSIGTTSYVLYGIGATNIPGWTIGGRAGANVALTSYTWAGPAEDGSQFLDPTGSTGGATISQTLATVPGTAYNLIFYHGTYAHQGRQQALGVTIGTNYYTYGETSGGGGNFDWQQVIVPFTAVSNQTALMFSELTGFDANDNSIDNVQVVPSSYGIVLQAVTASDGSYVLQAPNGTLQVGVSGLGAAGYNDVPVQTVTMGNANQTVNFVASPVAVPQVFAITTGVNPSGAGTVTGAGNYAQGATVTVTAAPITTSLPYSFSSWTENGVFESASASYSFTAVRNQNLVANFALPVFTVSATNNPSTAGAVTGAGSYVYGSSAVLTATPAFGYIFSNWTEGGTAVSASPTLSVTVLADHSYVANYAAANTTHIVTTVTAPPGVAAISGAGSYNNGATANFSAPLLVTNGAALYTFQEFTLSNTVVSMSASYSKTFSTLDATNLQYVAVYLVSSIAPQLTNVTANYSSPAPATTNFVLRLQFDRSMNTNVTPVIELTNAAATLQPVVPAVGGYWTNSALSNDTYYAAPVTFSPGMDGTMQLFVSGAQDTNGNTLLLTNPAQYTVIATPPANPVLSITASNSSSITVGWPGYSAPADLAGFRVFIQTTNYTSTAGLPVLTGLGPTAGSYQFAGLFLDTPYYVVVQAVDVAGNTSVSVTPLAIVLPSSLPPAVTPMVTAVGASSALVSWSNYNPTGLLGFAGYQVYYQQTPFTSVAGLTPQATVGPTTSSFQLNNLDRTKKYYFAVVAYNDEGNFNPNVTTASWSDPYAGSIAVNTTIGGSAPGVVNIYQSMTVVDDAQLTITPGTTLAFAPGTGITVQQGALIANGTALAPIIFDSVNDSAGNTAAPGNWAGVTLGNGAGGSSLQFVEILYGGGLTLNACAPSIQALTANFNAPTGLALADGATLTTTAALISGNQTGVSQSDTALLNIQQSVIQNNLTNALDAGSLPMTAPNNWWGTAAQSGVTPLLTGNVGYSPFLTNEPLLTPALGASNGATQIGSSSVNLELACRTASSYRLSEDLTFSGVFFTPFTNNYVTFPLSAGGGLKHIFAQFRSVTGLTNSPLELDVNYITGGPVIQSFSLYNGETLGRPTVVTGSATAVLGMADMELYVDGVGVATNLGGSFSSTLDVRTLSDAVHQVELLARDNSGNIATLEEDVVVAVTPPLAPVLLSPNSDYVTNNNNINIVGTAEPNIAIQVSDNGQVLGSLTTDAGGNFSLSSVTLQEGVNSIVAIASDITGQTASGTRQITVETIPPAALVLAQPVYVPGVGISLTWQFPASGKQATLYQVFWSTLPFTTTNQASGHSVELTTMSYTVQGLANGTYYFGVVGFDAAGNTSPLSSLVSISYNATPPALAIAYGANSPVGPGPLAITLTSSKSLATTPSLTIQPNGAPSPVLLALTNVALNTWQTTLPITPSTPSGTATVSASAQDQFGNTFSGAPAGPQLVIDTTPPSGVIVTAPTGPVQTINNVSVAVNLTLTKLPAQGTTPSLSFAPPQGAAVPLTLTGSGTNWNATLGLTSAMGSGFGTFSLHAQDSLGNVGTVITSGGQLEIYNTALPSPPNSPQNLTAVSLPGGNIQLSWNAVGNAQIYRLYREPGTNFQLPATLDLDNLTTTIVTDLPPADGLYTYAVTASRLGSESAISNAVVAVSDRTPPPAPTNVTVQLAATGVEIAWQEPIGEYPDHFNIYRNGAFIESVRDAQTATDYPPRGTDTYVVSAVDAIGNENFSLPASIQLLVGPVNNLTVLVQPGQAPVLTWSAGDSTTAGFNVYRNGILQNTALLTQPSYTDPLPMSDAVTYGVSAVNGSSQESPQRVVTVVPLLFNLLVNAQGTGTSHPVLTGYFDQYTLGITNLSSQTPASLTQVVYNRSVAGATPLVVTQALTGTIAAGGGIQASDIVPEAAVTGTQTLQVTASQQVDMEGDLVSYQQTFTNTNSVAPQAEVAVSVNQLPLAGGLTPFQVQVFNRCYVDIQMIVSRANGQQPGDLYISVQNGAGQEVSRTYYQAIPPGSIPRTDGSAYVDIAPGASFTLTVSNVLVPAALAGSTNTAFVAIVTNIYSQLGLASQQVSGPLSGSMVSSLSQTPYYGTAQTDHSVYTNDEPILITGQALDRTTGLPVPNVPLNIGFSTRGFAWDQPVTTDANGNYQYSYTALPGFGGTLNLWAAHPLVVDQLNQAQVVVDRVYAQPATGDVNMSKNGTLNFSIQLYNPGDVPLTGFASSFAAFSGTGLTPEPKITGQVLTASGFSIAGGQTATVNLQLAATIDAPSSAEAVFTFTSAEGATATFTATLDLAPAVPVVSVVQPQAGYLEVSVNRGDQVSGEIVFVNVGLTTLQGITIVPPTNSWMAVNLPVSSNGVITLPDLPVGQTNSFSIVYGPPAALPLAFYADTVTIQATNLASPLQIPVDAIVTSDLTGSVQFFVDDILGDPQAGAQIRLNNSLISANVGPYTTDTNGLVTISNLEEGSWSWQASASGCSASSGSIDITADQVGYQHARLNRNLVTVDFSVVPVPFSDSYTIQITENYETHVPIPVLVVSPLVQEFDNVTPGFQSTYNVTVQNSGLAQMENVTLSNFQNNVCTYQPLISFMPLLLPQQSVQVPYTVTYWGPDGPSQQGGNAGCLSVLNNYLNGYSQALGNFGAFYTQQLLVADSILQASGQCPTDGSYIQLGAQAAANLYATAQGMGFAAPANQAAAMAAYMECLLGNVGQNPFTYNYPGNNSYNNNFTQPANPQNSGTSFQTTGGGCLAGGTRVLMADGSEKPISAIVTNDTVRSGPHPHNLAVVKEISRVRNARVEQLLLRHLHGETARPVTTTDEHLFWVDGRGWVGAGALKAGDWLSDPQGEPIEIVEIRPLPAPADVYTLRLDMDNAFYANGVLVHDLCGGSLPVATSAAAGEEVAK